MSDRQSWADLFAASPEAYSYSLKAWYCQRRTRPTAGSTLPAATNAPDGKFFGYEALMAERIVDSLIADNPSLVTDAPPLPMAHVDRWLTPVDKWQEFTLGVDAMFDLAELTGAERVVWELIVDGRDSTQICIATGKAHGTVHALRNRGLKKIRGLRPQEAA